MYWAILKKAGFAADESQSAPDERSLPLSTCSTSTATSTRRSRPARTGGHAQALPVPANPTNLDALPAELEVIAQFRRDDPNDPNLIKQRSAPLFDADDVALLGVPQPGHRLRA